jgi:hypothetical protein
LLLDFYFLCYNLVIKYSGIVEIIIRQFMDQENKNKKKISPNKRRYLSVLLFLAFAVSLCLKNINVVSAQNDYTGDAKRYMEAELKKGTLPPETAKQYQQSVQKINEQKDSGGWGPGTLLLWAFNSLLYGVFMLVGVFLIIAGILFDWIVDAKVFLSVMNMTAIKTGWTLVRDILNIVFILVLLFSAFCTIFQINRYHLTKGKVLLNVVIMALLVNFSFPITRFIIDASNVIMYFFLQSIKTVGTGTLGPSIADWSNVKKAIFPGGFSSVHGTFNTTLALLAAIIFLFIFTVTILVLAMLLIIRMLVLAILIIFSPVGFVASIFPGFSQYSSKWWDALFRNAFFGPIMAFMIYLATLVMKEYNGTPAPNIASKTENFALVSKLVSTGVQMALPITILWIGMITAKSMGAMGASTVTNKGAGWIRGAGKWTAKAPWRATKAGARATGIPGGAKQGWENFKKTGKMFGAKIPGYGGTDTRDAREAKYGGFAKGGPKGYSNAITEHERNKANEIRKKWKDQGGASDTELKNAMDSKDRIKQKAAAMEMAEKNGFGNPALSTDVDKYRNALASVGSDPVFKKMFDEKVKEKHIRFVIESDIRDAVAMGAPPVDAARDAYRNNLSRLSPDQMAKQEKIHEDIRSNPSMQNYILTEVSSDPEYHKEFFKKLSREKRQAYIDMGLNP